MQGRGKHLFEDVDNSIGVRNVYGGAKGWTTGVRGTGFTPYNSGQFGTEVGRGMRSVGNPGDGGNGGGMTPVVGNGIMGRPLTWWFLLAVLLFGLMWTAQRVGTQGEEFRNIKMSTYNVLVIAFAAIIGIGALKVIFGRIRIPGLSDFILAV